MQYTQKIIDAIRFSIETHEINQKQKRKGKDILYITHPLTVGLILARAGADENVIVAGILHDTIEDSIPEKKVTKEILALQFGNTVANLVDSVTEQDRSLSWTERKTIAHKRISEYSEDSTLLKSADVLSNVTELIQDYEREGKIVFERFNAPRGKIIQSNTNTILALIARSPKSALAFDLQHAGLELTRISAHATGGLVYIEWNISFIELETEGRLRNSKFKDRVLERCRHIHQVLKDFEEDKDEDVLQLSLSFAILGFDDVVKEAEADSTEREMEMLLYAHVGDAMKSYMELFEDNDETDVGIL